MEQVQVTRSFPQPLEKVFDRYTDHVSWTKWAGMGKVRLAHEGVPAPNGVGCVRVIGPSPFGMHEQVVSFERPRRMTYKIVKGFMPMRDHLGEVVFEPDGQGTRVTWGCRFEATIPGLGTPLRLMITRIFRNALEGLAKDLAR